jgi:hypothetical protein
MELGDRGVLDESVLTPRGRPVRANRKRALARSPYSDRSQTCPPGPHGTATWSRLAKLYGRLKIDG